MAGAFEHATRAAIEEMIQTHAQESKFGYVLSQESFKDLAGAFYDLLMTSRTLKSAGDRFLAGAAAARPPEPRRVPTVGRPPKPVR